MYRSSRGRADRTTRTMLLLSVSGRLQLCFACLSLFMVRRGRADKPPPTTCTLLYASLIARPSGPATARTPESRHSARVSESARSESSESARGHSSRCAPSVGLCARVGLAAFGTAVRVACAGRPSESHVRAARPSCISHKRLRAGGRRGRSRDARAEVVHHTHTHTHTHTHLCGSRPPSREPAGRNRRQFPKGRSSCRFSWVRTLTVAGCPRASRRADSDRPAVDAMCP